MKKADRIVTFAIIVMAIIIGVANITCADFVNPSSSQSISISQLIPVIADYQPSPFFFEEKDGNCKDNGLNWSDWLMMTQTCPCGFSYVCCKNENPCTQMCENGCKSCPEKKS